MSVRTFESPPLGGYSPTSGRTSVAVRTAPAGCGEPGRPAPSRAPFPPSCRRLALTKSSPSLARSAPALRSYRRSASRAGRLPPEPPGPMAKRRAAEPLTFHVPWKRLLLCDFPEEPPPPPLWIPPAAASHPGQSLGVPELPRKRRIDAGAMTEPSVSPSKRHDGGDTNAPGSPEREGRGWETGESPLLPQPPLRPQGPGEELLGARPPRGGGDNGAGRAQPLRGDWGAAPRQLNEEFWQYNTFQYWRNPLPPIDLADIEDVSEDNLTEARLQGKNEVVEIDMES